MKKAEIVKLREALKVCITDIPDPPRHGLVVKISYSGICHSDILQLKDEVDFGFEKKRYSANPKYKLPISPGHEMSGIVHSIGSDLQNNGKLKIGDRVAIYPWRGCGSCRFCDQGNCNFCSVRDTCYGFGIPGGYASHVVVPEARSAILVPDAVPLDVACMLPCAGVTTYNAVSHVKPVIETLLKFQDKASLLIVGAGGLGLWCLQIAQAVLPSNTKIIIADISEEKLATAKLRGCDDTVLWSRDCVEDDVVAATKEKGLRGGFDAVVDLVNSKITSERAFNCLLTSGIQVMVGLFGGAANFSLPMIALDSKRIQGIHVGSLNQLKELMELVAEKKLTPPPLQYFDLDEVNDAIDLVKQGKIRGRAILKFGV